MADIEIYEIGQGTSSKLSEDIRQACIDIIKQSKGIDFVWIRHNTYYSEWLWKAKLLERKIEELEKKLARVRKLAR